MPYGKALVADLRKDKRKELVDSANLPINEEQAEKKAIRNQKRKMKASRKSATDNDMILDRQPENSPYNNQLKAE